MARSLHQANKQTTFLINAWRFQALFVIFLTLSPVIYLYEVYIKKYEKYAEQLRFLKQRGVRLDPTKDLESQLAPENIQILTQKKQKRAGSQERKPGSPQRKRMMAQFARTSSTGSALAEQEQHGSPGRFTKFFTSGALFGADVRGLQNAKGNHSVVEGMRGSNALRVSEKSQRSLKSVDTAFSLFDVERSLRPMTFWLNVVFLTLLTALLQVFWQSARVWGSLRTIQSHAFTLTNLHGILLVPYMYYARREVHKYEFTGSVVALLGALIMIIDPYARRVGQQRNWTSLPLVSDPSQADSEDSSYSSMGVDFALLFSNIPACLLFALNKALMRDRLIAHLFFVNLFTMAGFIVLSLLYEEATLDMNPHHGLFAWLRPASQFNTIILLGFGATFWGSAVGYTLLMRFLSPHICMNLLLLEPVVAQIYGIACGIDHVPGSLTLFGVTTVLLGVCYVNAGAAQKQQDRARVAREYDEIMRRQGALDMTTVSSQGVMSGGMGGQDAALGGSPQAVHFHEGQKQVGNRRTHDLADLVIEESIRQSNRSGPKATGRHSVSSAGADPGNQHYFRNRLQEKAGLVRQSTPESDRGRTARSDRRQPRSRSGSPERSASRSRSGGGRRRQRRRKSPRGIDGSDYQNYDGAQYPADRQRRNSPYNQRYDRHYQSQQN